MDDGQGFRGLRLHNTLTGKKEDFVPFDPENVRMYVCGPTVYDYAHIGNARPVIVFDVLFRLLRHLHGAEHVTYVRNITDVDDKIILRAAEEHPGLPLNEAIRQVTETTERQFHEDVAALGCLTREQVNKPGEPPRFIEPRATEHIGEMVAMIETLVEAGYAYPAEGHVLFEVRKWKAADGSLEYGKLSKRTLDDMIAGARVEVAPYKRDPMDFVLWKPSKPGEPAWPSPWGEGRPGWHIECSAMADRWLWQEALPRLSENAKAHPHQFDIHGGGIDLVFPHHENEIAQSRCANHTDLMAKYWLHNGFLQVEGRKMAKSEGNFVTIRELLRGWQGEPWAGAVVRNAMLSVHYRQPIDWTRERLEAAKAEVLLLAGETGTRRMGGEDACTRAWRSEPRPSPEVITALSDDLNTPLASSSLRQRLTSIERLSVQERIQLVWDFRFLGVLSEDQRPWLTGSVGLSGMPPRVLNVASLRFRNLRVFAANRDAECEREMRSKLSELQVEVRSPDQLVYRGDDLTAGQIDRLVESRVAARKAKNFAEADRIRSELDAMGIQLRDSKDPATGEVITTWEVKR